MPIKIENDSGVKMGTADKDYFLDDNGEVTTDEEKAATLLIRAGQDIPKEIADQYGIGEKKTAKSNPAQTASDDEGEKASSPKSNKAESPKTNKGAK